MLTIGSLFSGVGGLELGLEWAGLGPVLWQVEQSAFCRRKLAWRYPDAKRFTDVREVGAANLAPVDLICGGFPCQDISVAGEGAGLHGPRSGLWFEFARIVAECRPRWVVVENVASNATEWVGPVREALERLGYATLPIPLEAAHCGAPHRRARVFIVGALANSEGDGCGPGRLPLRAEAEIADAGVQVANATHAHDDARVLHDLRDQGRSKDRSHALGHGGWAAEPALARVVHGLPGRVDYERALGNSVVPQCAEVVGRVIVKLLEQAVSP